MGLRIGIPRALWYYSHYPFWRTFLENLGTHVVVSPPTGRDSVDAGILETVSEACVPIKIYFGHIRALLERWEKKEIDAIFIPRYVNWSGKAVYCPKFLGLPDMVRHSFTSLPQLIEARIDRRNFAGLWRACNQIRKQVGASFAAFLRAFRQAMRTQLLHERKLKKDYTAYTKPSAASAERPLRLALLGYPYLIQDHYISLGLLDKLKAAGVEVVMADAVPQHNLRSQNRLFRKRLFWTYSDIVARAGYSLINNGKALVDGVIHVTAFGCGPDAMVDKLLELRSHQCGVPFLTVTLDEHSGEAGIVTRLEAFVDMLRRRRQWHA